MPSGIRITRSRSARSDSTSARTSSRSLRPRDHELELILVARHQLRQHLPAGCAGARAAGPTRGSSGVELASFGLMLIRSQATGAKTVPAVSMVMCSPRARSRSVSATMSGAIIGSPPVTTTCRAGMRRHLVQNLIQRRDPCPPAATTCRACRTTSSADCSRWCG